VTDYSAVLTRLHPDRQWTLNGNDYDQLVMIDEGAKPSKKSLDDAWPAIDQQIAAEKIAKAEAKASAEAKLAALGLSADEIAAFKG
jgi:hypothetical protein